MTVRTEKLPFGSPRTRVRCGNLVDGGPASEEKVSRFMRYQGRTVEIFGWTPKGQAVPVLPAEVEGEDAGDYAFINGRAVEWDGRGWAALPWKDFAVWKLAHDAEADEASAGFGQAEVALGDVVSIDLTSAAVDSGNGAVPGVVFDPAVRGR